MGCRERWTQAVGRCGAAGSSLLGSPTLGSPTLKVRGGAEPLIGKRVHESSLAERVVLPGHPSPNVQCPLLTLTLALSLCPGHMQRSPPPSPACPSHFLMRVDCRLPGDLPSFPALPPSLGVPWPLGCPPGPPEALLSPLWSPGRTRNLSCGAGQGPRPWKAPVILLWHGVCGLREPLGTVLEQSVGLGFLDPLEGGVISVFLGRAAPSWAPGPHTAMFLFPPTACCSGLATLVQGWHRGM